MTLFTKVNSMLVVWVLITHGQRRSIKSTALTAMMATTVTQQLSQTSAALSVPKVTTVPWEQFSLVSAPPVLIKAL
jgi:hypothetical protein